MRKVGGNMTAVFQVKTASINEIGENVAVWSDALTVKGWLDLSSGDSKLATFNAKIQESTHVWVMDCVELPDTVTEEGARMVIGGKVYEIQLIDNPMELGTQIEVYLKYIGGQNGG